MSSDSEDDCYGNVAQQLQSMKNKYQEDKIETTNLLEDSLNDSAELDEIVKNCKKPLPKAPKTARDSSADSPTEDLPDVSQDITPRKTKKRATRNSKKASANESTSNACVLPPTRGKKKKTANATAADVPNSNSSSDNSSQGQAQNAANCSQIANNSSNLNETGRGRGRGKARGRKSTPSRSRGRRRGFWAPRNMSVADFFAALMPFSCNASIPTYSVGNTEEYYDQSEQQQLFTNKSKKSDDVIVEEQDISLDDNEELSVKVYWQSSEFFKFQIRKYQKLSQIFDYFSKKENVAQDKLLLTFNDRILKPDDTPDAIGYSIVKFIDGGVVNQSVAQLATKDDTPSDGIKLKFQCQNTKKPLELSVRPDDRLSVAMLRCAEHLEIPLDRLRFEFDGDLIPGKATASELELEGGECIDVKILS